MVISVPISFKEIGGTLIYKTLANGRLISKVDPLENLAGKSIELDPSQAPLARIVSYDKDLEAEISELSKGNTTEVKKVTLASCCSPPSTSYEVTFHE